MATVAARVKDRALYIACRVVFDRDLQEWLIAAGAGATFDEVEKFLAFSCVGRWTGAGSPDRKKRPGGPCNWTLGGLFTTHKLEVVTADGRRHPRFEPATREQAIAHRAARNVPPLTEYGRRVRALEAEGMSTSDAQAIADMEDLDDVTPVEQAGGGR